jgi:hypothetical protein
MKSRKLAIVIVGTMLFLFGLTSGVWAGGAGGVLGCCVADRPGIGHFVLKGTIAVVYSPPIFQPDYIPAYIDVKLRVERGEKIGFFELNLGEDIYGLDNFEIGCLFLNPEEPKPTGDPDSQLRVEAFVDEILSTFFPGSGFNHTNRLLVLTRKSISDTDGSAGGPIPFTDRIAAIGDVKIYVVDPAKVKLEANPNCR